MKGNDALAWVKVGGVVILGFAGVAAALRLRKAVDSGAQVIPAAVESAKKVITEDLNPANPGNVVNQAVSKVGAAVTGKSEWSLGGAIRDLQERVTGTGAYAPGVQVSGPSAPQNVGYTQLPPASEQTKIDFRRFEINQYNELEELQARSVEKFSSSPTASLIPKD